MRFTPGHLLAAALGLAVIAGIVLRFVSLDAMEFKGDEFKAFALAAAHLQKGTLPLVGLQSSTGLFNPPFFLLLLWPAIIIKTDPLFVTRWIVVLNAAGIIGLFFFLRRIGGTLLALCTGAIVAMSPWLFVLSRKIWAQDALLPFLVLTGWLLVSYVGDRRSWRLWGATASMALLTQLHMSAWAMPVATILWLALLRVRPRWRDMVIAACVFLVCYAPYIAFHIQDGFQNLTHATTRNAGNIFEQLRWLVGINGAVGLDYVWGPVRPAAIPAWLLGVAEGGTWLIAAGALAGVILVVRNILGQSASLRAPQHLSARNQYVLFLLCTTFLSFAGYIALGVPSLPFYHLVFLPLVPLLCAIAVTELPQKFRAEGTALLVLVMGVFFALIISFLSVITGHPEQLNGDYGVPYRNAQEQWAPYIDAVQNGRMRLPGQPEGE